MDKKLIPEELLVPLEPGERNLDMISTARISKKKAVINRFMKNNVAMLGLVFIIVMVIAAAFTPFFYVHDYNDQNLANSNISFRIKLYVDDHGDTFYTNSDQKVWIVDYNDKFITQMKMVKDDAGSKQMLFALDEKTVILDYNNKKLTLLQGDGNAFTKAKAEWNRDHILGTDSLGRDMFIRIVYGARISLLIAFFATIVNLLIGIFYGSIAGYHGGKIDNVLMRIVDIISTIPMILYVILIMITIGSGLKSIILAIGSVFWVDMARIVRGQVISLKNQEYVMAAKTIGTSSKDIILRHILPNTIDPIIISLILNIPKAIFTEAFLSYLGLGVPVPLASWGTLCNDAIEVLKIFPYQLIEPSIAICLTMFAFNFLGDGLRDALSMREV